MVRWYISIIMEKNFNSSNKESTMKDPGGGDDEDNKKDGIQEQMSLLNILTELDVPSNELQTSRIQNLMLKAKLHSTKESTNSKHYSCCDTWITITDRAWDHLTDGLPTLDDQLLCATCFYTVLNATDISTKQLYMQKVLKVIQSEIIRKENGTATDSETSKAIALMYGIFQSNFLVYTEDDAQLFEKSLDLKTVTKTMIKLLILMAYEYSKFTYITFKTMSALEKIRGLPAEDLIFDKENCDNLLVLINHNWENPITGVRDLNKKVLYCCLSAITSHEDMKYGAYYTRFPYELPYNVEMDEMTKTFYMDVRDYEWNKAKYLMGVEMIKSSFAKTSFSDGVASLNRPGVVAAGADLYYVILEKTETIEDWCWKYMKSIAKLLRGPSEKAIENFTDYWCVPTLKKFPAVLNKLVVKLGAIDTEYKLLSYLSLYKQAKKLGIINNEHKMFGDDKVFLTEGLNHCNTKIRMLAFEILCMSHDKEMPDKLKYDTIIYYLNTNINSDSRVLRINMLKSLTSFLTHLHEVYRSKVKNNKPCNEDELFKFCTDYQALVTSSLQINGNYQRKVTCIELIDTLLNNLSHVQRKRKELTKVETSLIKALECKDLLILMTENFIQTLIKMTNDPADDVKDNTNKILLKYYVDHLKKPEVINNIIDEALKSLSSKFFYEISCGHSKFNLIIDVLLQSNVSEATFKSVEEILQFAFENLMSEHKLGRGIVESIEKGKQLHSYITLICAVFQKCRENNYHIQFSREQFFELLKVSKGISNQFAWELEDSTSSDFAKMNEMVEAVISKSGYDTYVTDETKLSGMHQIVLNCLWLNVKASCELSCIVIQYQQHEESSDICESALTTITRVLETCRHKGAIEAAGVALGKAIRHLTSFNSPLSSLPMEWLQKKMQELVSRYSAMASVTRRGAGLSIMLHRAVANDARKDKPLFQYFINTILEACNKADTPSQPEISNSLESSSNTEVDKEPMKEDKHTKSVMPKTVDTADSYKLQVLSETDVETEPTIRRQKSVTDNTEVEPIKKNTEEEFIQTDAESNYKKDKETKGITEIRGTEEKTEGNTEVRIVKENSNEGTEKEPKEKTEKDVPKAVYIHFLTRIVTDSSLTCDVMFYSAQIAELAFGNLNSPHWQIRNAALQLYGALLPKLIGQKKSASEQRPFATVGCDELRTHSPKLWEYMMQRLHNEKFDDVIQYHSTLVPILNVLANCAKRYNLDIDLIRRKEEDEKLLQSLERLLESPIHTVRKLTAKSIYNIASFLWLKSKIMLIPHNLGENAMNGRLMLLWHYMQYDINRVRITGIVHGVYEQAMYSKNRRFEDYDKQDPLSRSYVNKHQFLEAYNLTKSIDKTWEELLDNFYAPGIEAWAKKSFEINLFVPSWIRVPLFLKTVMQLMDLKKISEDVPKVIILNDQPKEVQDLQWFNGEEYLEIVLQKVETAKYVPEEIDQIIEILLKNTRNVSYAIWKILYEIVKQIDPQEISHIEGITSAIDNDTKVCYKTRYVVPFAARIVQVLGDIMVLKRITDIIVSWTDAETTDCDLRYIAALAINELANNFEDLPDELKITVIKSAVLLLQDEDENVRNTVAVFYVNLVKCGTSLQPYICLSNLLDFKLLSTILSKEMIHTLCKELTKMVTKLSTPKEVDEYNPFSNDASNIYLETDVLKRLICAVESLV